MSERRMPTRSLPRRRVSERTRDGPEVVAGRRPAPREGSSWLTSPFALGLLGAAITTLGVALGLALAPPSRGPVAPGRAVVVRPLR